MCIGLICVSLLELFMGKIRHKISWLFHRNEWKRYVLQAEFVNKGYLPYLRAIYLYKIFKNIHIENEFS